MGREGREREREREKRERERERRERETERDMKIESFEKCKKQVDLFIILNGGQRGAYR